MEDKRKTMDGRPCDDRRATIQRNVRNDLKINNGSFLSKVKESKGEKSKVSSSSKEEKGGDGDVAPVPVTLAWERYPVTCKKNSSVKSGKGRKRRTVGRNTSFSSS